MSETATFHPDSEMFQGLLESAPDSMIIVDKQGKMVIVNAQTERIFGYTRDEMLGKSIDMLVPQRFRKNHPEHRNEYVHDPRVRPMGAGLDLYALRKDGTEFPVEISLSPIQTPAGLLVVSAIRDTTERVRVQRELQQTNIELAAANSAKDSFLASMSHELRTPLNAVIGFTGTMLMKLPGPINDEQERQLQIVRSSAQHLLSLINDILDLAKIESGKTTLEIETIPMQQLIEEVINSLRSMAETKGLVLSSSVPTIPIELRSDRRAVRQIITNLTDNAIKYTEKGSIKVELDSTDHTAIVRVTDTGIGIDPNDLHLLFKPFQQIDISSTRRTDGVGLGLHLCTRLAALLHATIGVESRVGEGSTFTFTIPV